MQMIVQALIKDGADICSAYGRSPNKLRPQPSVRLLNSHGFKRLSAARISAS